MWGRFLFIYFAWKSTQSPETSPKTAWSGRLGENQLSVTPRFLIFKVVSHMCKTFLSCMAYCVQVSLSKSEIQHLGVSRRGRRDWSQLHYCIWVRMWATTVQHFHTGSTEAINQWREKFSFHLPSKKLREQRRSSISFSQHPCGIGYFDHFTFNQWTS